MDEELNFTATIDRSAILSIKHGETIISQRKLRGPDSRGSFLYNGEAITWLAEIRKIRNQRGRIYLYFYPINLNYTSNPVEVIEE